MAMFFKKSSFRSEFYQPLIRVRLQWKLRGLKMSTVSDTTCLQLGLGERRVSCSRGRSILQSPVFKAASGVSPVGISNLPEAFYPRVGTL